MDIKQTERVRLKVPVDPMNEKDDTVDVGINGHFWRIKRGAEVTVPAAVFTLLEEGGYNPSMLGVVEDNGMFTCEFCGREIKSAAGLSAHVPYCERNPDSPKYTG